MYVDIQVCTMLHDTPRVSIVQQPSPSGQTQPAVSRPPRYRGVHAHFESSVHLPYDVELDALYSFPAPLPLQLRPDLRVLGSGELLEDSFAVLAG